MKPPGEPNPAPKVQSHSTPLAVGAATLLASGAFRQALGLLTLGATARLLSPEDFGVAAYFLIATALLEMLQRQIALVLIRLEDVTQEHLETTLTFQLIFGVCAATLFYTSQPLVAMIGIPELVQLTPALSALSLVVALRSPRFILFERKLRFGYAAGEETLIRIVYSVTAITLAWYWQDFWAIVVANFCALSARAIWTFSVAPMKLRLSLVHWRDSFSFSSWSVGAQLAQFFAKNTPQLVIGATLGLADAGVFRLGNRLCTLVTTQLFAPLQRVFYPGLAEISRNTDRSDEVFNRINELLIAVVLPISVGMALVANHMIIVVLGWNWLPATQVIWVLAPLRALETLQANVRAATYVAGSTKLLFIRNTILLALVCLFMWFGVQFEFTGALIATGASSFVALLMTLVMAKRFGTRKFLGPLVVAWRSFVATGVMALAVLFVSSAYGNVDVLGWAIDSVENMPLLRIRFSVQVLTGIIVYVGTHLLLWNLVGRPDGFEKSVLKLLSKIYKRFSKGGAVKQDQTKT